jgi:hypothetical protein
MGESAMNLPTVHLPSENTAVQSVTLWTSLQMESALAGRLSLQPSNASAAWRKSVDGEAVPDH